MDGRRVAVGNRRLMEREHVDLGPLAARREELASGGRTAVIAAVDGRAAGIIGIADAARETYAIAVAALHHAGIEVVMLTGDNEATARRIADQLGIDTVIAEVHPTRSTWGQEPQQLSAEPARVAGRQATGPWSWADRCSAR